MTGNAVRNTTQAKAISAAKKGVGSSAKNWLSINRNYLFILVFATLALYVNTFNNDYVYDDYSAIEKNVLVTGGIKSIPELMVTPYRHGFVSSANDLYRPLTMVMFAVEYQLFNGEPSGMHVVNVLLYVCCVLLMFRLLDRLFLKQRTLTVFVAALLFALHPLHTEVVANIKSGDELLCFLFAFFSLDLLITYSNSGKLRSLVIGLFCFLLSLLAKETSITFIFLYTLIFLFYQKDNRRRSLNIIAGSIFIAAFYVCIRYWVLNTYHANESFNVVFIDNQLADTSIWQRIATAVMVLGIYLKLLIFPHPLIFDYSFDTIPTVGFGSLWVWLSVLIYLVIAIIAVYRLLRFRRDMLALAVLFYLISISLFSNVFFLVGAMMAERFVFLASVGFCLAVAVGIEKLGLRNGAISKKALFILAPVCFLYGAATIMRNNDWENNFKLFSADVNKAPHNARINFCLGNEQLVKAYAEQEDMALKQQLTNDGLTSAKKALSIYPSYSDDSRIVGVAYYMKKQVDSAEFYFRKAIKLNNNDAAAWDALQILYFNAKRYGESIATNKHIISVDPASWEKYRNIALCYMHLRILDSAELYLRKGIALNDQYYPYYRTMAALYKLKNQPDSTAKYRTLTEQMQSTAEAEKE